MSCISLLSCLTSCGGGDEKILIYTTTEVERTNLIQKELDTKFPQYDIVLQTIGTGSLVSKLLAEGKTTSCDIFFELEIINAERILSKDSELFYDLKDYDFSNYDENVMKKLPSHRKYAITDINYTVAIVNKKVLENKGLDVPSTYEDLLNPKYKDLIEFPNPNSSGTGYALYNGLLSAKGDEEGLEYFKKLDSNIREYTTSGSTPLKDVIAGNVAVGFGMLWQCVEYASQAGNEHLEVVVLDNLAPSNYYTMGMINHSKTNPKVKEVFDYLFNEVNKLHVETFVPNKVYKDQDNSNYQFKDKWPNFEAIEMKGLYDYERKLDLLDKWVG